MKYFTARGDDDGFWYVYNESQLHRAPELRDPCVILVADQWPDGGEETARRIAAMLNDDASR